VETFGILVILSFAFIFLAGLLFAFYAHRSRKKESRPAPMSPEEEFA
jgi:hypothetical protein